jgi:hypothetical protein
MLTLLLLGCAGFISGFALPPLGIALISFTLFAAWTTATIYKDNFGAVQLLMLLSYLTALQAGYLIGSYVKHTRNNK